MWPFEKTKTMNVSTSTTVAPTRVSVAATVPPVRPKPGIVFDESGNAWEEYESSLFKGLVPAREQPARIKVTPTIQWMGARMAWAVWQQALAFLLWGYRDAKGENQGRFYYNPVTREWAFSATPQWRSSTLATQEIPHDDATHGDLWAPIDKQFSHPWEPAGTIHTHGSASAFQSGTDSNDEESQNGLHITVGNCDKPTLDLHSRLYFRKQKYGADLRNWIELPSFRDIPGKFVSMIHEGLIKDPPPESHPFPEAWKKLVVQRVYTQHVYQGGHSYWEGGQWEGHGGFHKTPPWDGNNNRRATVKRKKRGQSKDKPWDEVEESVTLPKGCRVTAAWVNARTEGELRFIVEVAIAMTEARIPLNYAPDIWMKTNDPIERQMTLLASNYEINNSDIYQLLLGKGTTWTFSEIVEAAVWALGPDEIAKLGVEVTDTEGQLLDPAQIIAAENGPKTLDEEMAKVKADNAARLAASVDDTDISRHMQ